MITELINILKNNERIYAWNVRVNTTNSYQLFFIRRKLDMNREVVVTSYLVSIYTKEEHSKKTKIGSASFELFPSMSEDEIKAKIEEQIELCKYTLNDVYNFPPKRNLKALTSEIGFDGHSLKEAAFIVADDLFEADIYQSGFINSVEIFVSHNETKFYDSNDNLFVYSNAKCEVEFITTWSENGKEIEQYKFLEFNTLDDVYIKQEANKMLLQAGERAKAIPMPRINNYNLVLSGQYVKSYFNHFAKKTCNDMIYEHASDAKVGTQLQKEDSEADKITIRLEPTMLKSTKGAPFDKDGIILRRLNIIEKGEVCNLWGSNDKSQYLSHPVFGNFENIVVNSGTLTDEDLQSENYLEIVSLSDFSIDSITGDFGSEIRLAYLHQKGKNKEIVTGGSISGNIYDSINEVKFSSEIEQNNNFVGPKKIMLTKVLFNSGE